MRNGSRPNLRKVCRKFPFRTGSHLKCVNSLLRSVHVRINCELQFASKSLSSILPIIATFSHLTDQVLKVYPFTCIDILVNSRRRRGFVFHTSPVTRVYREHIDNYSNEVTV